VVVKWFVHLFINGMTLLSFSNGLFWSWQYWLLFEVEIVLFYLYNQLRPHFCS